MRVCVELDEDTYELLQHLCNRTGVLIAEDVAEMLTYFAQLAAAGVFRPGSWERGWLVEATGYDPSWSSSDPGARRD